MPPETPEPIDDTGTLERLRQKLYAQKDPETFAVPALSQVAAPPEEVWTTPEGVVPTKKSRMSWSVLFLIIASVFFVVAVAGAAYFLIFGSRSVSTDRVIITPDGPTTIASGDTVSLLLSIRNNNPVPITATSLSVDFPESARTPEALETPLSHYEDTAGDIASGETGQRTVRVVLFGGENEHITLPIRFEYRVAGSNAVFVKEATYEVVVTSSPLSVRAEAVSEASAGQPLTFAVTVRSNAQTPLENVAVLAQYPFGFTARRGEGPLFTVGTLTPGEEKTITVTGTLSGEDSDQKIFRFTAGTRKDADSPILAISYTTTEAQVTLTKPFLATTLSVNRDVSASPVIQAGTQVQGILSWVNTLASPILDGEISVRLAGAALDTNTVSAYGGFYRSSDTTIIFSRETDAGLARLAPGDTGNGTFNFSTKDTGALIGLRNPTITATISVSGRRVGEANVPENVSSSVVRTIKVGTDLTLASQALYSVGAFKNTGPWPPAVDKETTYTIVLALSNTVNTVADATVSATLPSYVRFTGTVSPSDASVTYNATSRTVTWKAGDVAAGSGYTTAAKTVSFQVALLPSVSHRGTSPILMSTQQITGIDRFTQKTLSSTQPEVTTQVTGDPSFQSGFGEVR
jgi:hypothetical protein